MPAAFKLLGSGAVATLLYIPWFRAEAWEIPLPFELPFGLGDTLPIQPFGLLVAIGVLLGAQVAEVWGKRNGIAPYVINDMVFHVVVAGFIGAPLLNAALYNPDTFAALAEDPSLMFSTCLGMSSFGGFFGAVVGLIVWKLRRKLPALTVADAAVFALPFGWLFGRMGCFVVHDHPGKVTDFFLAVEGYRFGDPPYEPRHDLGLYEVLWSAAIIVLLLVLARKKRKPGFYAALVPMLYAPVRFFLDFLRAEPSAGAAGDVRYAGFTPGQYAAVALLALGAYLAWHVRNRPAGELPPEAQWPPPDEQAAKTAQGSSKAGRANKAEGTKKKAKGTKKKANEEPAAEGGSDDEG